MSYGIFRRDGQTLLGSRPTFSPEYNGDSPAYYGFHHEARTDRSITLFIDGVDESVTSSGLSPDREYVYYVVSIISGDLLEESWSLPSNLSSVRTPAGCL